MRLYSISIALISCLLSSACTRQPVPAGPKFSGSLLLLAGDNTNGAELVEVTGKPDAPYARPAIERMKAFIRKHTG